MDVVFYDRKYKCEVKASQLIRTNVAVEVLSGDPQDPPESFKDLEIEIITDCEGESEFPGRLSWHMIRLSEYGYKSPSCPSYMNYDKYIMESDLVFLRLD